MSWRPKLRTLFIVISLIVLILPLAGILLLRLYENALVRQTESNLIMQASWIIASYKQRLKTSYPQLDLTYYGNPLAKPLQVKYKTNQPKWQPQPATIDLNNDPVLNKPADAKLSQYSQNLQAYTIGQQLQPILKEAQLSTLAGIRVVDYQGTIIATTGQDLGYSLSSRVEVKKALMGYSVRVLRQRISDEPRPVLTSISRGTHIRIFLAHPVIINQRIAAVVILSRTPPDIFQVLYGKRQLLVYYGLLLLLLVIFIAWFTSISITRPIQTLVRQAKMASEGEQGSAMPRLTHPFIYEIDQLSRALNKMVQKQNKRASYIKNFASHVSHEFKTPITAIKGALELLNDHHQDMSVQEIEQFLSNINKDANRMLQLMKRLTQLAKSDIVIVSHKTQDLLPILYSLISDYKKKLSITIEADCAQFPVLMAKELIETIFINLIENAMQHGSSELTVQLTGNAEFFIVFISDNGCGISENNAHKVFKPFFTTTRKKGGTGLGLSIIKNLMQAHQGDIELQESQKGCRFKLIFKNVLVKG
jgi:signal transduction histidine kinase